MNMDHKADFLILGAGIYGLYSAKLLADKGYSVIVMDPDAAPFMRASYINQARVHNGYHYPRSYSTAIKSANYFERFNKDFSFAINAKFSKVYAISARYSLASGRQFEKFCENVNIPAEEINPRKFFRPNTIEAAYETCEYAFDAVKIRDYFMEKLRANGKVAFFFSDAPESAEIKGSEYIITSRNKIKITAPAVLNATYASINQILTLFEFPTFRIKYEICEIIKCSVSKNIINTGITVMDGPFFSVMPFGLNDGHSLSAVTFTPHITSKETLPTFSCQQVNKACTQFALKNCNNCPGAPISAWPYMSQLAKKYLNDDIKINYTSSLFAIKPIPATSEIDDSRPTIIKEFSRKPTFLTVLSGKINTVYDLEKAIT